MKLRRKFEDIIEIRDFIIKNRAVFYNLYIQKDLTAKKVAENQNIEYNNAFQKALLQVLGRKGKGLGGVRQGAGNKKGIRFCGTCRQVLKNCKCDDES